MPKEVIARCDDQELVVNWTKADSSDPMIGIGSWKVERLPDGRMSGWHPDGPQWAFDRETIGELIKVLRRAQRQVYTEDPA